MTNIAVTFTDRETVPFLKGAPYSHYRAACAALVSDWLDGNIGEGAPSDEKEREVLRAASQAENKSSIDAKDVQQIYDELVRLKAPTHLRTATSHRGWIRKSSQLLALIGVRFSGDIEQQVLVHDLSKYTAEEILGYSLMFGDAPATFQPLTDPEEKKEWELALEHHYISNKHHPEFFFAKHEQTGQRVRTFAMCEFMDGATNGKLYAEESVVDMMASRGERNLHGDPAISISKWLDIPDVYLKRYSDTDRQFVSELLKTWKQQAQDFARNPDNEQALRDIFDGRTVVE